MTTDNCGRPDGALDEILSDFLDEAALLLDRLNEDLLVLDECVRTCEEGESTRYEAALMNSMFRSAHSIKGLSAMLGLMNINRLTHSVENVFDAARNAQFNLDRSTVQVLFEAVDKLAAMVALLRCEGHDDLDARGVIEALQSALQAAGCDRPVTTQADAEAALDAIHTQDPPLTPEPTSSSSETPARDYFAGIDDEAGAPAKYLAIFIDETEMALDAFTEILVSTDRSATIETLASLLITVHRIKGSAASVGLQRPAKLTHLMEDILQELGDAHVPLQGDMVDVMLRCADALRLYLAGLKQGAPRSESFSSLATELLLAHGAAFPAPKPNVKPLSTGGDDPLPLLQAYAERFAHAGSVIVGYVRFVPGLALAGLKAQLIYQKLLHVGELLESSPAIDNADEIDTLEVACFAVATEQPADALKGKVNVAGVSEVQLFAATTLLAGDTRPAAAAARPTAASLPGKEPAAQHRMVNGVAEPAAGKSRNQGEAKPNETLRVDIERLDQLMNLAGQLVISKARFAQIGEGLKETLFGKQTPQLLANVAAQSKKLLEQTEAASAKGKSTPELEAIRSQARRMAANLEAIQRELSRATHTRNRVNELFEAVHQLDRVAAGIQKSIMDTRMVPIGPLFGRFKRVIRDITRLNSKDINLVVRGEKTELDKRMIDELGDPLIHMVRNSADHGIESPEARRKAGKSPQGTLTLDAFHRGNNIIIQVCDDGKGLDQARILAKAIEKNLVLPAEAERMTPQQAYQLIWEPGFSTAEKITEISGRGMGMDIVRSKIEELNGTVEVDSIPGQGTTFTIKLPLTLAILPSLMADIDGDVFALPVESIVEIVNVPAPPMTTVHGMQAALVRGRVVSVVELHDVFQWERVSGNRPTTGSRECMLVVVGHEGQEIGLRVDALLGEEDVVIKSIAENYRNVQGIAGASILGDGRVSLILDLTALIEMSACPAACA